MAVKGRLTSKLVLAFLFVALVPLGLLAVFGPRIVRRHFEDFSRDRIANVLSAMDRDLDLRRETIQSQVTTVASDPALVRELLLLSPGGAPDLGLIDRLVERRTALDLDWLEVTDAKGTVLARGHARGDFGISLATDPLIAGAMTGQNRSAVTPLAPPDSGLALLATAPVSFEGQVLGVVRGGTLLNRAFLFRLHSLSGAELAVLDSTGHEHASTFLPDPAHPDAVGRALAAMEAAPRDSDETPDSTVALALSDVPFRIGALPLMGSEGARIGRLAVGVSEADLERTLTSLLRLLGGAALIALFVAIGMALVFATRVSRPVKALALAAQRVAHGDLHVRLPAGPSDEVGDLMAAFNAMTVDLAGSRERLVRGERQAAWSQVARRLAHEIKNPLTPIQLAIEEVERAQERGDSDLDEVIVRAAKTIKAEVRALRELVREFADFARSPEPRLEAVDVRALLEHAVDLYVPSSIDVAREDGTPVPAITADPDLLARALGNLIKNACEAMDGQGTLTLVSRSDDGHVEIAVADSGPGIAREDREKIFTPYFTTKPDGTGLGLAIVRRIVEDHGGTLELAASNAGARFVVRLPVQPPPREGAVHG